MTVQDFMDLKPGDRVRWYLGEIIEGTVTSNDGVWVNVKWDDGMQQATPLNYVIAIEHVSRWMQRVRECDNPLNRSTNGTGA